MGGVCVVDGGDWMVVANGLWLVVVELWRWLFFFFPGDVGLDKCGCGSGGGLPCWLWGVG